MDQSDEIHQQKTEILITALKRMSDIPITLEGDMTKKKILITFFSYLETFMEL